MQSDGSDMTSESDSLITISPSLTQDLLVRLGGTTFSSFNDEYRFPYNDPMMQAERLSAFAFNSVHPESYWEPDEHRGLIGSLLGRVGSRALDIVSALFRLFSGSGMEGLWCVQMAHTFTNAELVGLDLVPADRSFTPSNVSLEVYDVNEGLPYPEHYFDVVHMRSVAPFIPDLPTLLSEVRRVLAPGGVFLFDEHGCELHTADGTSLSWFGLALQDARRGDVERTSSAFDPFKGAREFLVLKEMVEASRSPPPGSRSSGLIEPFAEVHQFVKEVHLGSRKETDDDHLETNLSNLMKNIILAHWNSLLLTLDGTAAPSKTLQAEVSRITDRDSGLFQSVKSIYARKKLRHVAGTGNES